MLASKLEHYDQMCLHVCLHLCNKKLGSFHRDTIIKYSASDETVFNEMSGVCNASVKDHLPATICQNF